jgi:uncharacterized protein (TIGR03437 family)
MKVLLLITLSLAPAFSQISEIATDGTGQTLLLSTRFRMQNESDVTTEQKIYRWQNGVWTRLRVHAPQVLGIVPGSIGNPFVAASGGVYGWYTTPSHGLFPVVRPHPDAEIFGVTLPDSFPRESIRVSANGRYVAGAAGLLGNGEIVVRQLLDIQTGVQTALPRDATLLQVNSSGAVAYLQGSQIVFKDRRFPVSGIVYGMAMSDDGRWIVADSSPDESRVGHSIRFYSIADGTATDIASEAFTTRGRLSWSLGNSRVVFLSEGQKRLNSWNPVSRQTEILADSAEQFVDLSLSADGSVAWAVTDTNRLWRFDLQADRRQEILAPLGFSQGAAGVGVPGSAMLLQGKFTREQQVFADGEKFPLSDVNADGYWFQVPWEWRGKGAGSSGLVVRAAGNPFENVASIGYQGDYLPYFPQMLDGSNSPYAATVIAAHSDFHGVVSATDPARGGENIHIYMTGLGALQRAVPTGVPGPFDAVPVVRPLVCAGQFLDTLARTDLLKVPALVYAGGMIGIYQLELTLPTNVPNGSFGLVCWDGVRETYGIIRTRP